MRQATVPNSFLRWFVLGTVSLICVGIGKYTGDLGPSVMGIVALASLLSSVAGFAFSALCGAMLFRLGGDPVQIVQIMITCSIANQAAMSWSLRREIDWPLLGVSLLGGALGLPVGVWILLHADRSHYISIFGIFLLLYGGYMLLRRPIVVRRQHLIWDLGAGFMGGITGGAIGLPSAFVTIWCSMKGWDKMRQRALFQPFILIMQVAGLLTISVAHSAGGNVGFDPADLLCVPAALLGTALGLACCRRLSDHQFARAVNILLVVSGLSYVV